MIEPLDVIETEEGGVAQLVTATADQWRLLVASGIHSGDAGVFAGVAVAVTGTAPARNPVAAGT